MSNPRITYQNLSNYFSVSASYPGYSATTETSSLQSYENADVWKSSVTSSGQLISIDFGSAQTFTDVVIDSNNFSDLNCTFISLIGADDSNLSVNATSAIYDMKDSGSLFHTTFASPVSKRYWGVKFYGAQSTYPYIGNLFLSNDLVFNTPYDWNYKTENKEYQTTEKVSLSGRIMTSQNFAGRIIYELQFSLQDNTLKTDFQTFQTTIRGKLRPFYFINTDGTIRYMHCTDDYVPVESYRYNYNNVSLNMRTHESDY